METSATMREYLAEIYRLQEDTPEVKTTDLAERLDVSAPAVPRMLKRLANVGLVKHVPYKGVVLTELGRKEALREVRRHRILEVFLVDVMGFTWDEAHEHADDLTVGLNEGVVARMNEMAGHPQHCPHGEPIPNEKFEIVAPQDIRVTSLAVGVRGKISRVRTRDDLRLQYFSAEGLVPGASFEIVGRAPFNGPMRLQLGRNEIVLGVELASELWVVQE